MKKLESTRKIHRESILRVYKKGFGYSRLKVLDNSDLFITAQGDDVFMEAVNDGDKIECYLWVQDVASYEFGLRVIGRITIGMNILFFEHTESIKRYTKRKCLTADVDLPVSFFNFETENSSKKFHSQEIILHEGKIIKMSDRECLMSSMADVPVNSFLRGHVILDSNKVEIVGKIEAVSGINEKIYSVNFMGMSDRERTMLLDFIFQVYRE